MDEKRSVLKVVVASPTDVQDERDCLESVVIRLNRGIARRSGLVIELLRWETDSFPGFHPEGAQGVIDESLKIKDCDVLIGIFWTRFGSPTSTGKTGTEHEIFTAIEARERNGNESPEIMLYFNEKPYSAKSSIESEQRTKVLKYKENLPSKIYYENYNGHDNFKERIEEALSDFIDKISKKKIR